MRVRLDEDTPQADRQPYRRRVLLRRHGGDLKKVYNTLSTKLAVEKKETEDSGLFALVAAAFALLAAAGLSLAWYGRVA